MPPPSQITRRPLSAGRSFAAFVPMLLLIGSITLQAQSERIGNQDIAAHVVTNPKSGRFWITGGSDHGGDTLKFLYASGSSFVTSNIVFQVKRNGVTKYYSNLPPTSAPGEKPIDPQTGQPAEYRPYDTLYVSANKTDTLAVGWRNLDGFDIILRFMTEKRRTAFDRGGDMLLEFDYKPSRFSSPGTLGIMMMLDSYNSNAVASSGGGQGDQASVLTSSGYFPSAGYGKKFDSRSEQIPEWYQVGNFTTSTPLNTVFPIHRLSDTSHGGRKLTAPSLFAIGSWRDFRHVAWDPAANIGTQIIGDAATIIRWDSLWGEGKVVTAFGLSDREGNNMFTCRDSALFVSIRTHRLLEQVSQGAPFSPSTFDVEMWVTNTEFRFSQSVSIELMNPVTTTPPTSGRLSIDPASPSIVALQLAPGETRKIRWTLNAVPGDSSDPDTVNAQLQFRYFYENGSLRSFKQACTPTITLRDFHVPPPPGARDTVAPVVRRTDSTTEPRVAWDFEAFDRHEGYMRDSGIDTIVIDPVRSSNMRVEMSAGRRCDTTSTYRPQFVVIDIRKPGAIYFEVIDCAGNATADSLHYMAPADTMSPVLLLTDSGNSSEIYWQFDAFDRHPGYRFDSGIDTIIMDESRSSNFVYTAIGGVRCDTMTTLQPRFTVIDADLPGVAYFDIFDCAGNSISDSIVYRGDIGSVAGQIVMRSGMQIESVAPNPIGVAGADLVVTLRNPVSGSIGAVLVSIDGIEIPCSRIEPAGDRRIRITLPPSLAAGHYQLRISAGKSSDAVAIKVVR